MPNPKSIEYLGFVFASADDVRGGALFFDDELEDLEYRSFLRNRGVECSLRDKSSTFLDGSLFLDEDGTGDNDFLALVGESKLLFVAKLLLPPRFSDGDDGFNFLSSCVAADNRVLGVWQLLESSSLFEERLLDDDPLCSLFDNSSRDDFLLLVVF